jgi:hypothetical protein
MEGLSKAYEVLQKLISKDGYKVKNYTIHAKYPAVLKVHSPDRDTVELDFIDNRPKVKVKKIFTISLTVIGITLHSDRGVIKINGFPDVPFDYSDEV